MTLQTPQKQTQFKPNQTQFQSHRLYAYFNFLLWDVVRRKLCSVTV